MATDELTMQPERVQFVLEMVRKKGNAALSGVPGNHFFVYPPQEFIDHPDVLKQDGIHENLKATVWLVKWHDGKYDQLSFQEFMVFIHQIIQSKAAFLAAQKAQQASQLSGSKHRQSKHAGGWQPKKDRDQKRRPRVEVTKVQVKGMGFNVVELASDPMIRALFEKVQIEPTVRPPSAMN